ncbi:hypothetical protein DEU56DRAFT_847057 [Suillus clintonianus]|uniref:uncharacterized protein n=1 Tax=Suillus clintonianus TaxID=1904413 RepID=UPI001B87AEE2|nr:uncharacterized protein DEU56DRAFT_847057 [Suillus clintonianus]KAG2155489.1 hypothetical protein DEU56DRAFT_847057 [Suillus clintonianus]
MSPETSTQPSRPSKPITRSSIRHSLNFTSVGKALADVINKESREKPNEKALKKSKDSSRRLSAIALMNSSAIPQANATASSKSKSPIPGHAKEDTSPSTKTITRSIRRQSGLLRPAPVCDDMGLKVLDAVGVSPSIKRSSTLRPRTAPAPTSSALPKYRPKSTLIETVPPKKPVSPARAGTRRRLSSSEEEDKAHSPSSKGNHEQKKPRRPISPLPHRALTVKVNLPNLTPPTTPSKIGKLSTPKKASPAKVDSARPAKSIKTTATSSASRSNVARPPSSSSSRSSVCSQSSPQTPSKSGFGFGHSKNNQAPSPLRSTGRPAPESPLAHHSRQHSTATLGRDTTPTPLSQLAEEDSEDSIEVDDVELLLAPAAPLGAPTPAIPRIRAVRPQHNESELQTPSRPQFLPTRANLSYLSPVPPTSQGSPSLRPLKANGANRGSIMSWEQLAHDGSQIIAQEEVEKLLSEIQAPFTPAGPSPNVSVLGLEVPESPCLSALPSPGGYGSISQVLLPDVTPSPAAHHYNQVFDTSTELPAPMDSGTVTLLRLQVASAENTAKERLVRLQLLEEQLHAATNSRIQETEELAKQVSFLEQQLHISVEARERLDEERSAFTASLQDQLRHAATRGEQASNAAFARGQEEAAASWADLLNQKQQKWEVCSLAREIKVEWASVREQAEVEQEFLQTSRETLNVFLAMLDQSQKKMHDLLV